MNLNKVFIVGRLTADPILRTTPGGQSVTSFSVATNRNWADKSGNRQEEVEYHNIVAWGRQAEIANQFLTKGAIVMVEGRIRTRSWTDKQNQTKKTTEIICERLQLGPRAGGGAPARGKPSTDSPFKDLESNPKPDKDVIEEIPVINLEDTEDIKPEDIPF
ncbi:MAG: single-stranded DNA-binding protein [Candidatus Paceibacterota bacterium]|jgi:single-strand DNA-binding protein